MAVIGPGSGYAPSAGNLLHYQLVAQQSEQVAYTGWHYRISLVNPPNPTLGEIVAALDQVFAPLYIALLSSEAIYRGSMIRKVFPLAPSAPAADNTRTAPGGVVGTLLPRQTSGVISKQTLVAGAAFRGRCYTAFGAQTSSQSNGIPTAAYVTSLTALANAIAGTRHVISLGTCDLVPCLMHRPPRHVLGDTTDISRCLAKALWGTQRRRGSFGRPNTAPF